MTLRLPCASAPPTVENFRVNLFVSVDLPDNVDSDESLAFKKCI